MSECITELENSLRIARRPLPFSDDIKASDDFLDPLFENFYQKLSEPAEQMRKKDYHRLAEYIPVQQIDGEVNEKLDAILSVAKRANPNLTYC